MYKPNKILNLIVAHDIKFGISKNGVIPWNVKKDIQFFVNKTTATINNNKIMYNALIMGSITYNTFKNKNFRNRKLFVITRDPSKYEETKNVYFLKNINDAIIMADNMDDIEQIFACSNLVYKYVLEHNLFDKMYITIIKKDYICDNFISINILDNESILATNKIYEDNIMDIYELFLMNKNITYDRSESKYLELLRNIMESGDKRNTRNSLVYSSFCNTLDFDLSTSFPLLTTKKMYFKGISTELVELFLRGKTNTKILEEKGVNIWKGNTSKEFLESRNLGHYQVGEMGPMYGYNWRFYGKPYPDIDNKNVSYIDQLRNVIKLLISNPTDRRIMMTTYNPMDSDKTVLDPCHGLITQFYVRDSKIECCMYQRSADMFLGVPFNISSYALLVYILAALCKLKPGNLKIILGDSHIYENHIEQIKTQLNRTPLKYPTLNISNKLSTRIDEIYSMNYKNSDNESTNIELLLDNLMGLIDNEIETDDFIVSNYICYEKISAEMVA